MTENESSNIEFGRVLDGKTSDRKVWFLIIPVVLGLGALLVFAGLAISKAGGLESKVRLAEQQVQDANKAVEERDALLKKARADESVLRSPGQGAAVMAAAQPESPASGVALVHPDQQAVKLFVFGLAHAEQGQEYRVNAIDAEKARTLLGKVVPDDRGTAFLLAKNLPEGATGVEVVLGAVQAGAEGTGSAAQGEDAGKGNAKPEGEGEAPASSQEEAGADATLILAGEFPKPGTAGVVAAPDLSGQAQARTPAARARRPLR